jgi:hypothetical protein
MSIGAERPGAGATLAAGIKVGDLTDRMNARIGAASTLDGNGFISDGRQGGFNRRLDSGTIYLRLPATERLAVVFDAYCKPHVAPGSARQRQSGEFS